LFLPRWRVRRGLESAPRSSMRSPEKPRRSMRSARAVTKRAILAERSDSTKETSLSKSAGKPK
jgi:hypothetical protein